MAYKSVFCLAELQTKNEEYSKRSGYCEPLCTRAAEPMLRVADVFVSRLDPQLIACDLQNYLVGKLHIEVDVERVKVTKYSSSFHVYS